MKAKDWIIKMKLTHQKINNIPVTIWGEKSNKVYIAVYGNMSHNPKVVSSSFTPATIYYR